MKTKAARIVRRGHKNPVVQEIVKILSIAIGAVLVGFGLEAFLVPNGFLDGGITGVSIIISNLTGLPVGMLLGLLNIPFVILSWFKLGKMSAIRTAIGIAVLAGTTIILHHMEPWTTEFFLALAYGGALLGLGVGLALRQGGALDGTEALASILSQKSRFSVDQLILGVNILIFIVAACVLGPQEALASAALFYLAVAPIINKVVDGGGTVSRRVRVVTSNPDLVAETVRPLVSGRIIRERAQVYENGEFTECTGDISFVITRLQEASVTEAILEVDNEAVVSFVDIANLRGGTYENEQSTH